MKINKSNNIDDLSFLGIATITLMFVSKKDNLSEYYTLATSVEATLATKRTPQAILKDLCSERSSDFKMSLPNFYYIVKKAKDVKNRIKEHEFKTDSALKVCDLIDLCIQDFYKNRDKIVKK